MKIETPKEKKPRSTAQKWSRRAKIDEIIKELMAEKEEITVSLEQELKK